jgi:hypothetical protein
MVMRDNISYNAIIKTIPMARFDDTGIGLLLLL